VRRGADHARTAILVGGVSPERLNNQKEFFGEHCLIPPKHWHDHPSLPPSCLLILSGGLRATAEMVSSLVNLVSSDWPHEAGSRDREGIARARANPLHIQSQNKHSEAGSRHCERSEAIQLT
jgi:hypothetical protein